MAVDFFFMLSGFGICLSTKRPEKSWKSNFEFAISKIVKIYPAYVVSLVLMFPYTYMSQYSNAKLKSFLLFGVDLSLLQSVTGMTFFSHSINGVCWFLSCNFVCYILIAFTLEKCDSIRDKKSIMLYLILSIICVLILSCLSSRIEQMNFLGGKINDLWYGHPVIRYWYLFIGALLGRLYEKSSIKFTNPVEIGIALIAIVYFVSRNSVLEIINRDFLRLFDLLLCSLVLFVFSKGTGLISRGLSRKQMLWLGKMSMYLYLFHYPVRMWIDKIFVEFNVISILGEFGYLLECVSIMMLTIGITFAYLKSCDVKRHFAIRKDI